MLNSPVKNSIQYGWFVSIVSILAIGLWGIIIRPIVGIQHLFTNQPDWDRMGAFFTAPSKGATHDWDVLKNQWLVQLGVMVIGCYWSPFCTLLFTHWSVEYRL